MPITWTSSIRNLMTRQGLLNGFANPCAISVYSGTQPRATAITSNWVNYKTNLATAANSFVSEIYTLPKDLDWGASSAWQGLAYGAGKFVAIALYSIGAAYSEDGVTWTAINMPVSARWISIIYANSTFVAITYDNTVAATSVDGVTWTATTMPVSALWSSVTYGNGVFVAVAYNSDIAATSIDGITWVQTTLPVSATWVSISFGNGQFVSISYNSTMIGTSSDGVNWIQRVAPAKLFWKTITFGNGLFVIIAKDTDKTYTSPDGINWTITFLPTNSLWSNVYFSNGLFIAVSEVSEVCAISTDGVSWERKYLSSGDSFSAIAYGAGMFIILTKISISSVAVKLMTSAGNETPFLLGHFIGASWSQPSNGTLLQLTNPPASNAITTGIAKWAILWASNITRAQMDANTIPHNNFIVVPASISTSGGIIRFSNTTFTANVSKAILDGSIDITMK